MRSIFLKAMGICVILFLLAVGFWPYEGHVRKSLYRTVCRTNLKSIGVALHKYHFMYDSFPPAYTVDENGNRLLSWRVLILPFLEEQELYDKFRLDEPWNSENNIKNIKNIKRIDGLNMRFRCAGQRAKNREGVFTNYVAIVGDQASFGGAQSRSIKGFDDRIQNSIMIVEIAESDIAWSEPRDLQFEEMSFEINKDRQGVSSNHEEIVNVLFADGYVRRLTAATSPEMFKAMCTINGGEKVEFEK